jgi:hypothetical protein
MREVSSGLIGWLVFWPDYRWDSCSERVGRRAMLFAAMPILLGVAILLVVAFSLTADLLWKRWMARRRAERDREE